MPPPFETTKTSSSVAQPEESGCWKTAGPVSGSGVAVRCGVGEGDGAGDDGVLLRFDGVWRALESGVKTPLRASVRAAGATYITGDNGVVLKVTGGDATRVDLGTSCTVTGVFSRGAEVWFVGSEGLHAGVWRWSGDRVLERWGTC